MQRSSEIDIRVPSNSTTQHVEDILRQKMMTEPTEVVSREGTIYVAQTQESKPPGRKKDEDKSGDKKRGVKKSSGKKPGKKK